MRKKLQNTGFILIYVIVAAALGGCVYYSEFFPSGESIWNYIWPVGEFYNGLGLANITTEVWVRLFYAGSIAVICAISGLAWFFIGIKEHRRTLGFFVGLLWFFIPTNIEVLFHKGDLAVSFVLSILPVLLWRMYRLIFASSDSDDGKTKPWKAVYISVVFCLLCILLLLYIQDDKMNGYFGISIAVLLVLGAMFSGKRELPVFWMGVLLLFLSAAPLTACLVCLGFLLWKTLRKELVYVICILLSLDAAGTFYFGVIQNADFGIAKTIGYHVEETLLEDACEVAEQKILFLGSEQEEKIANYVLTDQEKELRLVEDSNGRLEEALVNRKYTYLFDRALELGSDTVLIKKSRLSEGISDIGVLTVAAEQSSYSLEKENDTFILYHFADAKDSFALNTRYEMIGIGTSAPMLAFFYPAMQESTDPDLNAYSYEELEKYKVIYLNGFTYHNKTEAEELLTRLSENGTRIIIEASGIPSDILSKNQEFLGVTCNSISFQKGYPILYMDENVIDCNLFKKGNENWKTIYLTNLEEQLGYFYENNLKVAFLGTSKNENIIFVGLNLAYHYALTEDPSAEQIYNRLFGVESNQLPKRTLVRTGER